MNMDPFAALRDKLAASRLEVYVSTFCGDCRRLKGQLQEHDITYSTVNISSVDGAAEKLESETGKRGVPYVLVNGSRWVRGYHREVPGMFSLPLFVADLTEALGDA